MEPHSIVKIFALAKVKVYHQTKLLLWMCVSFFLVFLPLCEAVNSTTKSSYILNPVSKFTAYFKRQAQRGRDVPDGMLDPFSILGFLSFATFLFSVLYHRYKDKNNTKSPMAPQSGGQLSLNAPQSPPNLEYLVKMATKILDTVAAFDDTYLDEDTINVNSTTAGMDILDYYDTDEDSSELQKFIGD